MLSYRLAGVCDFRHWDDVVAVYEDRSGDTHRLTGLGARVFLALTREPASKAQLLSLTDNPQELDAALASLDDIGLVEPIP
jgi:PqqD family protein of HPr-rel-A system